MEVVSHCAFPVAGRIWRPRAGAFVLTFVGKATFALGPGKLALAAEQQPVNEADRPWSEAVTSLYAASDLAPRKLRPEVVLIGNAYAPGGVPAAKVVARLTVGGIDKAVEVWCDRSRKPDGSVIEGQRFASLPLLYERAAGGPGTDNPVGIAPEPDEYGSVLLPNLTPSGTRLAAGVPIKPIGFGPVAARWPSRLARLGRYADEISPEGWADQPLPGDLDMTYFNVAPPDQQLAALRPDERIVLENLHRDHPLLAMTLPGIRLRAKVSGPGGEKHVPMPCDTLWIDTSRGICCLTYRGQLVLTSPGEPGWVVVSVDANGDAEEVSPHNGDLTGTLNDEPLTRPPTNVASLGVTARGGVPFLKSAPDADADPPTPRPMHTPLPAPSPLVAPPLPSRRQSMTMPFAPGSGDGLDGFVPALPFQKGEASETSRPPPPRPSDQALPFQSKPDALRRVETATPFGAPSELRRDATPFRPNTPGAPVPPPAPSSPGLAGPPGGIRPGWSSPPPTPPSTPQPLSPRPVPPPLPVRAAPVAPAAVVAPVSDSPWATGGNVSGPGTIAPVAAPIAAPSSPGDFRSGGGALLASNAAAGVVEAPPPRAAEPSRPFVVPVVSPQRASPKEPAEVLDFLYYDPEALPRVRRVAAWRPLIKALEGRPLDAEEDDPAAAKEPEQIEDRREILEILLRGAPSDPAAVDEAVSRAAREDGRYLPPVVLVSGDLLTPFDEIEVLKTTLTLVTPVAGNDENLKASMEVARELLKLPALGSSPQVVEGITARIRESYAAAKRPVALSQLDPQIERALVEQRLYQHRKVLGGRRMRALYYPPGSGESKSSGPAPLVTYFPEIVEPKLPLYARFKVRLVARVHLGLDPYEQGVALECLALGRMCPTPRRDGK